MRALLKHLEHIQPFGIRWEEGSYLVLPSSSLGFSTSIFIASFRIYDFQPFITKQAGTITACD